MITNTIDLGNGDSAELYAELRHGTSRQIEQLYRPFYARPDVQEILKIEGPDKQKKLLQALGASEDITLATDVLILGQVKSWTFGEVNQNTLDDMSERKRDIIAQEANRLYGDPLAESSTKT